MDRVLHIIAYVLFIGGFSIMVYTIKYRTDKCPTISTNNPIDWISFWKMRSWYTPLGFKLHLLGGCLMILSSVLFAFLFW